MPHVRILTNCLVSGTHRGAGEVVTASEDDSATLIGCGRAEAVDVETAPLPPANVKGRTKAQIAADLAAAKAAEAQLQADLSQATE